MYRCINNSFAYCIKQPKGELLKEMTCMQDYREESCSKNPQTCKYLKTLNELIAKEKLGA